MDILELMLQSSDLYAPYTGVALTSYLENNRDIDKIIIYFLADNVSELNKDRMVDTVKKYNRTIYIYDVGGVYRGDKGCRFFRLSWELYNVL